MSLRRAFLTVEAESGRNARTVESDYWFVKKALQAQGVNVRNGGGIEWFQSELRRTLRNFKTGHP